MRRPTLTKALSAIERRLADPLVSSSPKGGGYFVSGAAAAAIVGSGVPAEAVTPELVEDHLYAPEIPPIDLLIRTGGEQRLSNFMLWRAAYAELRFLDKMWPAFALADLEAALADSGVRTRRFGA